MPTIIAICPYCRAGGVRAPDTAMGASATCPKCKSSFTVLPEENLPEWAAKAQPDAKSFSAPGPAKPQSSPLAETIENRSLSDVTEPSPVLPAEPKRKTGPKTETKAEPPTAAEAPPEPQVAPAAEPEDEARAPTDLGMVFALVALCLVGPTMVATLLPFGRFIALALAAVGFGLGMVSLGAEGRARRTGAAAVGIHFVALVVLLFLPSWLGLDAWNSSAEEPPVPEVVTRDADVPRTVAPGEWIDTDKGSWRHQGVQVSIRSVATGPVQLLGPNQAKRTTKERYLQITVRIVNLGLNGELELSGWAANGTGGAKVTDANGALAPATFENGWEPERSTMTRVPVAGTTEVTLRFAAPTGRGPVRIQLEGSALGSTEVIRFRTGELAPPTPINRVP
jgi:hypothetical protein